MRKFFSVCFSFMIFTLLIFLSINLTIERIIVDTISDSIVKKEVSNVITDVIYGMYPDISIDNLVKIENMINDSKEVRKITEKYFENIMESVNDSDSEYPDISDNLEDIVLNNRSEFIKYGVSSEDIDKIVYSLDDDSINQVYKVVNDSLIGNLTDEQRLVIGIYNILSSDSLKYSLIIGIVVLICIICLINWNLYSWLVYMGSSGLISGLIIKFVIIEGINMVSWDVTNKVLGRTSDINVDMLNNISIIYMLIGLLLIVVYSILKRVIHNNVDKIK